MTPGCFSGGRCGDGRFAHGGNRKFISALHAARRLDRTWMPKPTALSTQRVSVPSGCSSLVAFHSGIMRSLHRRGRCRSCPSGSRTGCRHLEGQWPGCANTRGHLELGLLTLVPICAWACSRGVRCEVLCEVFPKRSNRVQNNFHHRRRGQASAGPLT